MRQRPSSLLKLETLEVRRMLSADSPWLPLIEQELAAEPADDSPPIAEPAVLVGPGGLNADAASLLAAGGPGDPALPGFSNVARSGENGSVVYLGAGWALTANHVSLTSSINFGGTFYAVDTSSIRQLHNANGSGTDLKMFRVVGDPPLPELLSSFIATAPPSGHVFMIGNGLTRGQELFWSVDKSQTPWVWTQISEPVIPTPNTFGGVSIVSPRVIRWGDNVVRDTNLSLTVGGLTISAFTTQFDDLAYTGQPGQPNEAQASAGDSGGAVFSFVNGKWVLSGLMIAVSGPLSGQPSSTAIYGSVTVMIDLSVYRDEILSIVGVAERNVFYDNSSFDGNTIGVNPADDLAIATDKSAYLPGSGLATFASVTSFVRGINGIMVDLASTHGTITTADFSFKVGNNNSPSTWVDAPAPTTVSVRPGAGVGGSDRIEIVWASGAIVNQWLEVVVKGDDALGGFNSNTGLAASDVFFWGNKVADSGTSPGAATFSTTTTDAAQVFASIGTNKPITDLRDYNRDGQVNTTDAAIVFASIGSIVRIDVASGGPFAPLAEPAVTVDSATRSAAVFALSVPQATSDSPKSVALAPWWESHEALVSTIARAVSRWDESRPARVQQQQLAAALLEASDSPDGDASLGRPRFDAGDAFDLTWLSELSHRPMR